MNKLFLCLLTLLTSNVLSAESKNHIVILLDTSSSMEESMSFFDQSKMEAAKEALISVVDKIPVDTKIGFLGFNESWFSPLGDIDRLLLKQAIKDAQTTPYSGTPLGTYLKVAADTLLKERESQFGYGTYKILVVTDGNPTNEPENLVKEYLPEITYRGITVDCIGVNMPKSSVLKNKVHKYMSADDPNSLKQQVENTVLAEISTTDDLNEEFSDIALISDEVALTVISNLDSINNYPIGEKPEPLTVDVDLTQSIQVDKSNYLYGLVVFLIACLVILGFMFLY